MDSRTKRMIGIAGAGICAVLIVVVLLVFSGGKKDEGSSSEGLTVYTGTSASSEAVTSAPAETVTEAVTSAPETVTSAQTAPEEQTTASVTEAAKEYVTYSFRSKKLYEDHFKKHGSEFGNITKEEYLKLANDMLNSDSDTILHKTEKEDGDDVFFDTATGYFLVLSTDGYIRTFFIPDKGIDYYNRQ
ncbi:MAG: hypothetical protein IKP95_06390 [Ruminococcus sp.]|nr:hypothetical protein [Ruminococcus sp.]